VFDAIFLTLIIGGWLIAASAPWFLLSVATRGNAGLGMLPLSWLAGLAGAFAVPLLGANDANGLRLSFAVAFLVPVALLAVRRFSLGATRELRAARTPRSGDQVTSPEVPLSEIPRGQGDPH
jgi:hypothetical protein